MVQELSQLITHVNLVDGIDDEWLWKCETTGCSSVKSFCLQVAKFEGQHAANKLQGRKVWRGVGVATPKAELAACLVHLDGTLEHKRQVMQIELYPTQ